MKHMICTKSFRAGINSIQITLEKVLTDNQHLIQYSEPPTKVS